MKSFFRYLSFFLLPLFLFASESKPSNHRFYAQPIFFFVERQTFWGGGVGYRFHKDKQGCDVSLNFQPLHSRTSYWPFLKSSYLFYPTDKGLYLGIGANLGAVAGLLGTLGYELYNQSALVFLQLDVVYPSTIKEPLSSISLGIGF